ncbi:MAG: ABC transporter permease [Planctomycetales bacterium]
MSLSFNPTPFDLLLGLKQWLIVVGVSLLVIGISATFMSLMVLGKTGPIQILGYAREAITDLFGTSWRRCLALTQLTFFEALRRKTLMVFAVFAILFMFAGWFMSDVTADPSLQVKAYISFVLRAISWLILPVVLLLSCWGLPEDIRARSLHTVVTKPVRRHEIVLGRILGYSLIGGLVLAVMGFVGYVWIVRQLRGNDTMRSHLIARVPIFGELSFVDRDGRDRDTQGELIQAGINVGDENPFRSFVEGATSARARWDFGQIDTSRLANNTLVLESSLQSFRTHKGNMKQGLLCQFTLINQATEVRVPLTPFEVQEFRRNTYNVAERNRSLSDVNGKEVDLIKDVLSGGALRVEVQCLSGGQFLGMARPDLFIRLPDNSFLASYVKCLGSIGLMMLMVVVLGVMFGCFVKGPVATVATAFVVILGRTFHGFMEQVATGVSKANPAFEHKGRGILDSLIRIPTHQTPSVDFEDSFGTRIVKTLDNIELGGLWAVKHLIPDFSTFDTTEYAANAFDVPWAESLLPSLAVTIGYGLPWIVVGYFFLKFRELEAK